MPAVQGRQDGTESVEYAARLAALSGARWKQVLDVQAPYRWNLRRLLGDRRTLDVGCGIGRNLADLPEGSVGVDHNEHSVRICRERGLTAYTSDEFLAEPPEHRGGFTGLLAAHLVEHLPEGGGPDVLGRYLPYLAPGARVVLICPQERGFASDATHTVFTDHAKLRDLCDELGLEVEREFSFPLPRFTGKVFTYNEFVTVAAPRPVR
ncbi:class I SAM-dependent methyltransferase [Pseudonocardia sp. K10HN5]|uniref:Class I SAM-dependent methyltransferase n=1 Tax=Pseudonocardia acidicola TaxID=2724939 RepID=A0ABX1SIX3_9PSEU|nr:class I SAM-dependent methyltransferase [Pseudonocardia acidicola]